MNLPNLPGEHYLECLEYGDSVFVTARHRDTGEAAWQFEIDAITLPGDEPALQIRMFDDAFQAYEDVPEVFAALARQQPTAMEQLVKLLDECGAVNMTDSGRECLP